MKRHLAGAIALPFAAAIFVLTGSMAALNAQQAPSGPVVPAAPLNLQVYVLDIGQGASTLIWSPSGQSILVDGGPSGAGTGKIAPLLDSLGITTLDYTVVTHYHTDHENGVKELLTAGRVAGIAYDNGDGVEVVPPSGGTLAAYLEYVAATAQPGVPRTTITPGTVIDLGSGVRLTCVAAGGHYLSGGSVPISTADMNTESIALLLEYGDFDLLVSGDLTGGGTTATARGPDIETAVGQMVRDVDVYQVDHHGASTGSNRKFLKALKAEVAFAQAAELNTFGHPNLETANRYLNTPVTSGATFPGTGVPTAGTTPIFYQTQPSNPTDTRTTPQGWSGAAPGTGTLFGGPGTLLVETDGTTGYTVRSFDDGGVRVNPALHTLSLDGAGAGATLNFPPTVVPAISPEVPLATDAVVVSAQVADREDAIGAVVLDYSLDGTPQTPVSMTLSSGMWQGTIPAQPDGTRVEWTVTATAGDFSTSDGSGYWSGTTPISALRALDPLGETPYFDYVARVVGAVSAGTDSFSSTGANDDYVEDGTAASTSGEPSSPRRRRSFRPPGVSRSRSGAGSAGGPDGSASR